MAAMTGLVDTSVAFGKDADLERTIARIGWEKTPFSSTIKSVAPQTRSGNVASGRSWFYDVIPTGDINNRYVEGNKDFEFVNYQGGELKNHYQIAMNPFGVTGSASEGVDVSGRKDEAKQLELSSYAHKNSIEQILLSDLSAIQRDNTTGAKVAGRCAGIKSFAHANNTIAAGKDAISTKLIREALKLGHLNGVTYNYLMLSDVQMDKLDEMMESKVGLQSFGTKEIVDGLTYINTKYGRVALLMNPYLEDDEILPYASSQICKVNWRAMKKEDLGRVGDVKESYLVSEFTLQVNTPYAFSIIKGLAV